MNPSRPSWRDAWLPLLLVAVVLALGSFVRVVDLGSAHFNNDELYHVYAALSLEEGAGPLLPSGQEYTRGLDVTRMAGVALRYVDNAELAARLPSAILGLAGLALFAFIAWSLVGPWGAFWAVLFFAVSPEVILQTRIVRFYTYQMLFGLVALFAGWRALRSAGRPLEEQDRFLVQWAWIALALGGFALAHRAQPTTISVLVAWGGLVGAAAGMDLWKHGRSALSRAAPVQLSIAGVLGALGVLIVVPTLPGELWGRAEWVADWAGGRPGDPRTYYWWLLSEFPVIVSLLVGAFLVAAVRRPRLSMYLAVWFAVPFLLHSFVLAWKQPRYMILALPGLFLLAGFAAGEVCAVARRGLMRWMKGRLTNVRSTELVASALVGLACLGVIITTPAFNEARTVPAPRKNIDWTVARDLLAEAVGEALVPVGSSMPVNTLYYWERTDFGVATDLVSGGLPAEDPRPPDGRQALVRDHYTAVPLLVEPDEIRAYFRGDGDFDGMVAIAIDRDRWEHRNVSATLKHVLGQEATEVCRGRCGELLVFLWNVTDPVPDRAGEGGSSPSEGAGR